MTRSQANSREQLWIVAAIAIFVHALVLAAMLVRFRAGPADSAVEVASVAPSVAVERVLQPVPQEKLDEPVKPTEAAVGERTGEGDSIASVDLPDTTRSPQPRDFEQAWQRQEPSFVPPSQASPRPEPDATASNAAEPVEAKQQPFGPLAEESGLVSFAVPKDAQQEKPLEPDVELAAKAVEPVPPSALPSEPIPEAPEANTQASDRNPDPADAGPSDLDPFAKVDGIDFTRGGIKARSGREVKLVRPRIDLAFRADATELVGHRIAVKLFIVTDATGRPRDVNVLQSSGSRVIDDAVRLAMFDSWFGGKMPDAFDFTVAFLR